MQAPVSSVHYDLPSVRPGWELSEETMPESVLHDIVVGLLKAVLEAWAQRVGGKQVVRNLAVRWDEAHPRVGVDPDVAVLSPPPPDGEDLTSVLTWRPGHHPPALAIEVVSESHPRKDYVVAPDKYAVSGTGELWIFDPLLVGPAAQGGPFRLQLWSRDASGALRRTYAGEGPVRSPYLDAYLVPVDEGRRLRIAADAEGTDFWLTAEETHRLGREAERAAKEAERAAKEAERAAKDAALARIAELEALLARKG